MSEALRARIAAARATHHPLLCCGVVAGDPHVEGTLEHMRALSQGGADMVEVLLPTSEPAYHSGVVQRACQRALKHGVTLAEVMEQCALFREQEAPGVPLMVSSYMSRVWAHGERRFVEQLGEAGCDALHVSDLPWELSASLRAACQEVGVLYVPAVSPSTPSARLGAIAAECAGGVGVWVGRRGEDGEALMQLSMAARRFSDFTLLAALQIETALEARAAAELSGGVLVTSAVVWRIEGRGADLTERLRGFVSELRQRVDEASSSSGFAGSALGASLGSAR